MKPAGGHFIPSQMAAHDANSGSGPTRNFRETIQARIKRDPTFREELFKEGMECLLAGDVDTGKAVLRDYINATVGFQELGAADRQVAQESDAYVQPQRQPPGQKPIQNYRIPPETRGASPEDPHRSIGGKFEQTFSQNHACRNRRPVRRFKVCGVHRAARHEAASAPRIETQIGRWKSVIGPRRRWCMNRCKRAR